MKADDAKVRKEPAPGQRWLKLVFRSREMSLFLIVAVAFVVLWIAKGEIFFSMRNFEGIATGMIYDLFMAAGMTIVLILWGIDLSVGAILALTSVITAMLMRSGMTVPVAVILGLSFALLAGAANGFLISRFKMAPFIVTMAVMSIARGTALVLSSGYFISGLPDSFGTISEGRLANVPIPYIVVLITLIIMDILLKNWKFLNQAFFVGTNPQAASLSGINVAKVTMVGYLISALMAGFAAIFMSSKLAMGFSQFGQLAEQRAIAAAVIGGASFTGGSGSILGASLGVLLIAIINNGFVLLNGSPNWQQAVSGIILLVAVGVDAFRTRKERKD